MIVASAEEHFDVVAGDHRRDGGPVLSPSSVFRVMRGVVDDGWGIFVSGWALEVEVEMAGVAKRPANASLAADAYHYHNSIG